MGENGTNADAPQSLLGGAEPQGTETQSGSLLGGQPPAEPQGGQSTQAPEPQGTEPAKNLDAATQYEKFTIPEEAQKLVDLHVRHWLGFEEQAKAQAEDWRKQAMNDPEFGGQKFVQSLRDAQRFISAFGGEKLRIALDTTGAGNHPEIFKAFALAGRLLGEDRLVKGAGAAPAGGGTFADLANTLYPDMKNGGNS